MNTSEFANKNDVNKSTVSRYENAFSNIIMEKIGKFTSDFSVKQMIHFRMATSRYFNLHTLSEILQKMSLLKLENTRKMGRRLSDKKTSLSRTLRKFTKLTQPRHCERCV